MKVARSVSTVFIMGVLLVTLSACDRKDGPAESVGKKIDETTQKAGEKIEEAGESIQDAAEGDSK